MNKNVSRTWSLHQVNDRDWTLPRQRALVVEPGRPGLVAVGTAIQPRLHAETSMTTDTIAPAAKRTKPIRAAVATRANAAANKVVSQRPGRAAPAPSSLPVAYPPAAPGKLDRLTTLLGAPAGATIAAMMAATNWQAHSVRGAMAGALRKRGLVVTSAKSDGVRTYHASRAA